MADARAIEWLAGTVFAAGMAWAVVKRLRRDVNGLGRKLNEHIRESEREARRELLMKILLTPEKKREEVIWRLWEGLK